MTIQFLEEMIQEVNQELALMRKSGFDRVRILELGIIRMHLRNKQNDLYDEMEGEDS